MTITGVNDAPGAGDYLYVYSVNEDTTLTVDATSGVLANDTDAENDTIKAILVTGRTNGTLTLNDDGSFTYLDDLDRTIYDLIVLVPFQFNSELVNTVSGHSTKYKKKLNTLRRKNQQIRRLRKYLAKWLKKT